LYGPNSKEILEWGYTAKVAITKPPYKNHVLLSKYKLHLDDAAGPHPPLPNGLTVVDAIADYLRLFHAHVIQASFFFHFPIAVCHSTDVLKSNLSFFSLFFCFSRLGYI
jgi:hypothetical protein